MGFRGKARIVEVEADKLEEIHSSYSGDTIAFEKTIRKPFKFEGNFYISVGAAFHGTTILGEECYRIVPVENFEGAAVYYAEKLTWPVTLSKEEKRWSGPNCDDWTALRRSQPEGFYHRMLIKRGISVWVLVGPPIQFKVKEGSVATKQLYLF